MSEKKDEGMTKYGVQLEDNVKVASDATIRFVDGVPSCPWCKEPLDSVDPPHCPKHGTEPFERR